MGKDEHVFSHMINMGRFWMFSLYYVVSELWGSVRRCVFRLGGTTVSSVWSIPSRGVELVPRETCSGGQAVSGCIVGNCPYDGLQGLME